MEMRRKCLQRVWRGCQWRDNESEGEFRSERTVTTGTEVTTTNYEVCSSSVTCAGLLMLIIVINNNGHGDNAGRDVMGQIT